MIKKRLALIFFLYWFAFAGSAQSTIELLKDQPYLQYQGQVNCDEPNTTLDLRICANLRAQQSDSLMQVEYQQVSQALDQLFLEKAKLYLQEAQQHWVEMRSRECRIFWELYEGGSLQPVVYMQCLAEVTDRRTEALQQLFLEITGK